MLHLENVHLDAMHVIAVAIHVMMYIVGVICLLLVVEAAELEMEYNVQIMLNYLNNIANCKFGNQCIYCNLHKKHNLRMNNKLYNHNSYYNLHKAHSLNKELNQYKCQNN